MKKISEVSELAGISKRTLQYYDELSLLPVERLNGKDRIYTKESIEALIRILIYRSEGLKLKEIRNIITLDDNQQRDYLRRHIKELQSKEAQINEAISFANYIIDKGISDIEDKIITSSSITIIQQIEQLKNDAYKKHIDDL